MPAQTYPLEQLDLPAAIQMQFRLVEIIARHFDGLAILQAGDYGLRQPEGRPRTTQRVEAALADFFGVEAACLARGAGTGALRLVMMALLKPGSRLLVHQAPIYPTSAATIEAMGLNLVQVDYNDLTALRSLNLPEVSCALIQHSRQRLGDRYRLAEVIQALRVALPAATLVVDDNYVALRAPSVGIQLGAGCSTFSLFKLLGPEGIGLVLGNHELVGAIHRLNYSGGSQVQGVEAMEALRALVYAPVSLAIQAQVVDEIAQRLNTGEIPGVFRAHIANAQSRVVLVELAEPLVLRVVEHSSRYGAATQPVGAESRYEVAPLFYRISGAFLQDDPQLSQYMLRINPMRAGAELILSILAKALNDCRGG
jgi:selenocysteine lyase/cysteine desulfurase